MKDRRLRILWNSNAPWSNSGYGVHMDHLLPRFLKDGWTTALTVFTGLDGSPIFYHDKAFKDTPLLVYPKMGDIWGTDSMVMHGRHFQAQVNFSFQDVWPLDPNGLQQLRCWIPYVPIDKDPVPANVLDKLRFAYKIVTFSRFGQKALERAGFASTLIPESTDIDVFKPMDKIECRKALGLPLDKFIVGQIGANKPDAYPRKGWQQSLDAFALFYAQHPESIFFYEINQLGGFPIEEYANYKGIGKQIFKIDPYMSIFHAGSDIMAKMLNSFDILLHPSSTEGFGLVIVEAQACGIPVIVNNCTSMPELVIPGKTGEICETGSEQWSPGGGIIKFADPNSLHEKMEILFRADRQKIGKAGRKHVINNYNVDKTFQEKWTPFLLDLQTELLGEVDRSKESK